MALLLCTSCAGQTQLHTPDPPPPSTAPTPRSPSRSQGKFETLFFDHAFGEELGCIGGHFGPVNTLAFAPHGRSYASGGEDGYIRIHHLDQEYFEAYEKKVTESGILAADKA